MSTVLRRRGAHGAASQTLSVFSEFKQRAWQSQFLAEVHGGGFVAGPTGVEWCGVWVRARLRSLGVCP